MKFQSIRYQPYHVSLEYDHLVPFLELFRSAGVIIRVNKVSEKDLEVTLTLEETEEEIMLRLQQSNKQYMIHQTIELKSDIFENLIHKTIKKFNVDAVVHFYLTQTEMIYVYEKGITQQIIEKTNQKEKILYRYPQNQ